MARTTNRLTDKTVKAKTEPGRYADGDGLYLVIKPDGTKGWYVFFPWNGKRREMGLGAAADIKLAEVRTAARDARRLAEKRIDPIAHRKALKTAQAVEDASEPATGPMTLRNFASAYIDRKRAGWRGRDTEKSWRRSFEVYALPIAELPIASIETADILKVVEPLWTVKSETGAKLRERLEEVLDAARAAGLRSGDNPARWRGHLSFSLPKRPKLQRGHHPAIPHEQVNAFVRALASREGVSARALEWTLLTVARETMTLEAVASEVDRKAGVWTIPGGRMKSAMDFRIPISPQADAVLDRLNFNERGPGELIFPGARRGRPLSNAAMDMMMREVASGFVPHGLRSTFRDWAGDETEFPRDLIEEALAHAVGDETERAYRRRDALEKRRKLMAAWGIYCATLRNDD